MSDKPHLGSGSLTRCTIRFECSQCHRPFILPEGVPSIQGIGELCTAFEEHVAESHATDSLRAIALLIHCQQPDRLGRG